MQGRAPRILVFGEELPLRPAIRVAVCAGGRVFLEPDPARLVDRARQVEPDIVLFHYDHGGPAALLLARRLMATCPAATAIVLCAPSPPAGIHELLLEPWFRHLLGLESPWFMEALGGTLARLRGREIFGLHRHLPWGTRLLSFELAASDDKAMVFDRIEAFMADIGVRGRVVARLQAVADEMIMNAVYDAPVDGRGEPKYARRSRQERVDLEPHERPTLRFGSDGRTFGISVTDPFGGLTPETLKSYVAKGLRRGADQIDRKEGGAGLGLYLLFDSLHTMCLNRTPARRTEVVGLLDIRGSYRDVVTGAKSFACFERDTRPDEIGGTS